VTWPSHTHARTHTHTHTKTVNLKEISRNVREVKHFSTAAVSCAVLKRTVQILQNARHGSSSSRKIREILEASFQEM
jgi:hypothetical protein